MASRDIKSGEKVMKESPIFKGPSQITSPVCIGCLEVNEVCFIIIFLLKWLYFFLFRMLKKATAWNVTFVDGPFALRTVKSLLTTRQSVNS